MKLRKRILQSGFVRGFVSRVAALYIRLVYATTRWTVIGTEDALRHLDGGQPLIGCFWHARMLLLPPFWMRQSGGARMNMLISTHRDGLLIAQLAGRLGVATVAGSSTRGGRNALLKILDLLKGGESVAFTPDGPRGPRMRASAGAVVAARLSGVPICCLSYSVRRRRLLNSWDRFLVPLPFGRGAFVAGSPITVPRDADEAQLERARITLEETLNELTRRADEICGWPPVAPAPVQDVGYAGAPRKRRKRA